MMIYRLVFHPGSAMEMFWKLIKRFLSLTCYFLSNCNLVYFLINLIVDEAEITSLAGYNVPLLKLLPRNLTALSLNSGDSSRLNVCPEISSVFGTNFAKCE